MSAAIESLQRNVFLALRDVKLHLEVLKTGYIDSWLKTVSPLGFRSTLKFNREVDKCSTFQKMFNNVGKC